MKSLNSKSRQFLLFVLLLLFNVVAKDAHGVCTRGAIRYDPEYNNTVIQICIANRWGYICANSDERTRQRIADVICQQMGYSRHSDTGITQIRIVPAPTPGFMGWLYCSDKPILQQNIIDCSHLVYELAYTNPICSNNNYYTAASNCTSTSICQNGQIQLLNTNAVLLCVNGEWHALCSTTWSSTQAQVVCRQLGMNTRGAMPVNVSVPANISVLRANFECHGNEKFLYNCSDRRSVSYNISSITIVVAGVICEDLPSPPSNLTVNSQQSDIILHWEYTDKNNSNDLSNFSVYCNNVMVDSQSHLNFKTELNILTKNNNATLIGLLANIVYTCCVSAVFPYMETGSTCINVTGLQEICSSTSSTIIASSSSNGAISWIGGIFIGIIISAVFVIILLLIIKIVIVRRSKDKQLKPNKRSSLQNDNANVISTFSSGQNIAYGVCSQNQNPFESFTNRSDPTILAVVEYATPFEVLQQN